MSDTPRTDAEALKSRPPFNLVTRKFAEDLERECNQLRKDLKDSQTAVRLIAEALANISIGTSCRECSGEDQARLAKDVIKTASNL